MLKDSLTASETTSNSDKIDWTNVEDYIQNTRSSKHSKLFYPYKRKVALWKCIWSDGWSNKHRRLTLNRKIIKLSSTTISKILDHQNSVDYFCRNKRIVSYWWLHSKQMTVEQAFWDEDTTHVWIRNTVPRNKSRIKDSPEIKDICSQR